MIMNVENTLGASLVPWRRSRRPSGPWLSLPVPTATPSNGFPSYSPDTHVLPACTPHPWDPETWCSHRVPRMLVHAAARSQTIVGRTQRCMLSAPDSRPVE